MIDGAPNEGQISMPRITQVKSIDPNISDSICLTSQQLEALPHLLWIFDPNIARGTGKTYLLAVTAILLAMRRHDVDLSDMSLVYNYKGHRFDREFANMVMGIIHTNYKEHIFEFNYHTMILKYKGKKDGHH